MLETHQFFFPFQIFFSFGMAKLILKNMLFMLKPILTLLTIMEYLCGNCLMYPAGLQQSVLTPHWMGITYFLYPQGRPRGWI